MINYTSNNKTTETCPRFWSLQLEVVEGCNRACFTEDTKIDLLDGRSLTMKEVTEEFKDKEFWVYSCSSDGVIHPGKATSLGITKVVDKLAIVTLDNGEIIKCTPDHQFMLRDGSYVEIKYLHEGISLMPLYFRTNHHLCPKHRQILIPKTQSWEYVHHVMFKSERLTGSVIHHKNFNYLDNTPENLLQLTASEHMILHSNEPEEKVRRSNRAVKFCQDHPEEIIDRSRRMSRTNKKLWNNKEFEFKKRSIIGRIKKLCFKAFNTYGEINENTFNSVRYVNSPYWNTAKFWFPNENDLISINHKISKIEFIDGEFPVYDLNVKDYHNFALSAGIFVHNCSFCGIHSIRDKGSKKWDIYKYMSLDLVEKLALQINQLAPEVRIEIDNHGEVLLHPNLDKIINTLRTRIPNSSIQLQTNGMLGYKTKHNTFESISNLINTANKFFENGLNMFVVDAYHKSLYDNLTECRNKIQEELGCLYHDTFRDEEKFNHYHRHDGRHFVVVDDLVRAANDPLIKVPMAKLINNEGGNTPDSFFEKNNQEILKTPLKKACSRVFREITFGWNGLVSGCCYDWRNGLVMGKFPEQSVEEIWNSKTAHAMRYLMNNEIRYREFSPCDKCSYGGGGRIGLLPKMTYKGGFVQAMSDLSDGMQQFTKYQYPNLDHHVGYKVYNPKKDISLTNWNQCDKENNK